ncbi:ATP-binding cassette domain-containing protein [Streptomyces sp. GKU 257-1]|nr:ATP-binding cassette domain-containing protein [Streptomyces sp. GKU 257-1]
MIRFENVAKRYPDGTVAVEGLSFEVADGELVTLVGPSGCGKTTTMKMVNRLIEPTEGRILVDGADIARVEPVELRRRMGYVIQQTGLFPAPHGAGQHRHRSAPAGLVQGAQGERARELLDLVGLDPHVFGDRYPEQLSGGQRQRVGVARALAADPPVLLMDEPFGAVDPVVREHLQNEFLRLQSRLHKTVLFRHARHRGGRPPRRPDRRLRGGPDRAVRHPRHRAGRARLRVRGRLRRRRPRPQAAVRHPDRARRPGAAADPPPERRARRGRRPDGDDRRRPLGRGPGRRRGTARLGLGRRPGRGVGPGRGRLGDGRRPRAADGGVAAAGLHPQAGVQHHAPARRRMDRRAGRRGPVRRRAHPGQAARGAAPLGRRRRPRRGPPGGRTGDDRELLSGRAPPHGRHPCRRTARGAVSQR